MKTEKQIREWLKVREEIFMTETDTSDLEDYYKELGFIEGLKYVLEE